MRAPQPTAPGLADLMNDQPSVAQQQAANPRVPGMDLEDQQAVEQMLRRVEDDPGGLLRQRFLLQHLRRSGRLP
jgi:Ca-activated chloride channel family protein